VQCPRQSCGGSCTVFSSVIDPCELYRLVLKQEFSVEVGVLGFECRNIEPQRYPGRDRHPMHGSGVHPVTEIGEGSFEVFVVAVGGVVIDRFLDFGLGHRFWGHGSECAATAAGSVLAAASGIADASPTTGDLDNGHLGRSCGMAGSANYSPAAAGRALEDALPCGDSLPAVAESVKSVGHR